MIKNVVYPAVFEKCEDGSYLVSIPDLDKMTQGKDLSDAIMMARDLISLWIVDLEDNHKDIPEPNSRSFEVSENAIVSYVDADIDAYRKKYSVKVIKKNCTIPAWLNTKAEELNINFSQTLQEALMKKIAI